RVDPEPFQTVCFSGRRDDLTFVPEQAFPELGDEGVFYDDVGDRWRIRYQGGVWQGIWHSRADGTDGPWNARIWPQKGLAVQVDRILRRCARRPRKGASA